MRVALSRASLAGLAVFWGWSIFVNARDGIERRIAARLRHPMTPQQATMPHPRFIN
jgi:hypothetical protein